jgi:hypothetical protein
VGLTDGPLSGALTSVLDQRPNIGFRIPSVATNGANDRDPSSITPSSKGGLINAKERAGIVDREPLLIRTILGKGRLLWFLVRRHERSSLFRQRD